MPTPSEVQAVSAMLMMNQTLYARRLEFLTKAREVRLNGLQKKKVMLAKRGDAISKTWAAKKAKQQQLYEMRCAFMAKARAARLAKL